MVSKKGKTGGSAKEKGGNAVPDRKSPGASGKTGTTQARRKVKYVLDPQARKWLASVAAGFAGAVALAAIGIAVATSQPGAQPETAPADDEKTISLVGATPQGLAIVDGTGKFDGFLEMDGIPAAELYDTRITEADAALLEKRGQYPSEGVFAYNADAALRDPSELETADDSGEGQRSDDEPAPSKPANGESSK